MNNANKKQGQEDGPPALSNKKKARAAFFAVMNVEKAKLEQPPNLPTHIFFPLSAASRSFRSAWSENGF